MLTLLAAAAAAAQPAPAAPADPDVRCMAAFLFAVGRMSDDPKASAEDKNAATTMVMYFFGKVRARMPGVDLKGQIKPLVEAMDADLLVQYALACGWVLAWAHAKGGSGELSIAGYLGSKDRFDEAMGDFSRTALPLEGPLPQAPSDGVPGLGRPQEAPAAVPPPSGKADDAAVRAEIRRIILEELRAVMRD